MGEAIQYIESTNLVELDCLRLSFICNSIPPDCTLSELIKLIALS